MKPIKRGLKFCMRADSQNEYVCESYVYCGKDGDTVATNLGANVIIKLFCTLVGHLYFDNYFTSVVLIESLLEDGIYACGTYRNDRRNIPVKLRM